MEVLQKKGKMEGDNLEVTGISRSGRVRKKSSKLMDFESPDDLDTKFKRLTPKKEERDDGAGSHDRFMKMQPEEVLLKEENMKQELDYEEFLPESESDYENEFEVNSEGDFGELSETSDDGSESHGFKRLDEHTDADQPAQSLYLMEKSNRKRLVIKDGKIIGRVKAQRKDKGRPRCTAYMLWAREIRGDLLRTNPDMDFSTMSRRLGELWGTVPAVEKFNWRRRAKRANYKIYMMDTGQAPVAPKMKSTGAPPKTNTKFINKKAAAKFPAAEPVQLGVPTIAGAQLSPPEVRHKSGSEVAVYKVTGTQPIDVASHLDLLGESLRIIGERLKEHEGQIAVSGSLSVLLDSLLCALGPLICLTQQVPELNSVPPEQLAKTLDNIAYIMPGL